MSVKVTEGGSQRSEAVEAGFRAPEREGQSRETGRVLGVLGVTLALAVVPVALFTSGSGIIEGLAALALGSVGYLLGSRRFGGAAIVAAIGALFIGLSLSQHLF